MIVVFSNILVRDQVGLSGYLERLSNSSTLVLLNDAIPLGVNAVRDYSRKILIQRWHRKKLFYHGKSRADAGFQANYFLEGPAHNLPVAEWLSDYRGYPELTPTTGFWVWMLLRDGFLGAGHEICLVNFLGPHDCSTPKADCHNWDYEHNMLRGNCTRTHFARF